MVPNRLAIEPVYYRLYCGGDSVVSPFHIHTSEHKGELGDIFTEERELFVYPSHFLSLGSYSLCHQGCRKTGKLARTGGQQVIEEITLLKNEHCKPLDSE